MQFGGPTNTDAINFIYAAGLSDRTSLQAISTLVTDLKDSRLWDKMIAVWPFVGFTGSAGFTTVVPDSFKWNLKDPRDSDDAYRLTFIKGQAIGFNSNWYASTNGLKPNGYDQFAKTYITASSIPLEDFHFSYYSRTDTTRGLGGATTGGGTRGLELYPSTGSNTLYYANAGTTQTPEEATTGIGFHTVSVPATNTIVRYFNTSSITDSTVTFQTNVPYGIGLFAPTYNGEYAGAPGGDRYGDAECSFASIGYSLSDLDVNNLYTAVQKFQTTLGRQV